MLVRNQQRWLSFSCLGLRLRLRLRLSLRKAYKPVPACLECLELKKRISVDVGGYTQGHFPQTLNLTYSEQQEFSHIKENRFYKILPQTLQLDGTKCRGCCFSTFSANNQKKTVIKIQRLNSQSDAYSSFPACLTYEQTFFCGILSLA